MNRRALLLVLAALLLTGCGYRGAGSLPLPGGVSGAHTYTVTVLFDDATNLVARETCRTNDTVVGSVESVTLDDQLRAKVVCRIKDSVTIPGNAVAALRETSLLGERFVALDPPTGVKATGALARGTVVPTSATRADPDVEIVFGALSQVLNGGNLGALETITGELTTALEGSDLRGSIDQLGSTVGHLNERRDDITAALDSLDRLSGVLAKQRDVLGTALEQVPGGLAVLDRQRPRLVRLLTKLDDLSKVAVPLINRSQANTVADLQHLDPVLRGLAEQGDELAVTLERIATFPFPSNALSALKGDYGGMYATITLDVDSLNSLIASYAPTGAKAPTVAAERPPITTPTTPGAVQGLSPLFGALGLDPLLGALTGQKSTGAAPPSLLGLLGGGR
ncbi:MAG: hypothetical protein JWQ74_2854 [Marmoricola sp.]|nr:hypothetical protein [Marmoricola sp.]